MSSIGKDLASIRHHKKLTIEDIHRRTRIPLQTLKRIENGSIFENPNENRIYLRSFVRTYARALRIDEDVVLKALDQHEAGNYNRLLLDLFPDIEEDHSARPVGEPVGGPALPNAPVGMERSEASGDAVKKEDTAPGEPSAEKKESGNEAAGSVSAEKSDIKKPSGGSVPGEKRPEAGAGKAAESDAPSPQSDPPATESAAGAKPVSEPPKSRTAGDVTAGGTGRERSEVRTPPGEKQIDWARMGHRFSEKEKQTTGWVLGTTIIVLLLLTVAYFIYRSDFVTELLGDRQAEPSVASAPADRPAGAGLELGEPAAPDRDDRADSGAALEETLFLTVYAAHERLEPVRVWADIKPRNDPYWIEHGEAFRFEFRDTIRVQGQYGRMMLFFNGHRIDGFREQHFNEQENAVELRREYFSSEPHWARTVPIDVPDGVAPPDSILNRPVFF